MRFYLNICLIVVFITTSFHPYAFAAEQLTYENYLQKAADALRKKDHRKAIEFLKEAQKISPSSSYPQEKILAIEKLMRDKDFESYDQRERLNLYQNYARLGKEAFEREDYQEASYYFQQAYLVIGWDSKAADYLNLVKRAQDGKIEQPSKKLKAASESSEPQDVQVSSPQPANTVAILPKDSSGIVPEKQQNTLPQRRTILKSSAKPSKESAGRLLPMDDLLWSSQPKTLIELDRTAYVILEGNQIDRYIVITPDIVDVERLNRNQLKVTGLKVGSTFVHVWDGKGRWTFNFQVKFPQTGDVSQRPATLLEKHAEPFRFTYTIDGGTLYRGDQVSTAKRDSLNMQQTLALRGETPYGIADASVAYYKFKESTEATNYTVGLSGMKGAGFSSVNVRGYDAVKYFSPLTFPGQYFRGFLIEGKTLGEHLGLVYLRGQDRFTYSFLAPGLVETHRSYVEAARVTVDPNEENQYSFNYARGYGPARQTYLKNQVYSVEAQHRIDPVLLRGEVATNTDNLSETLSAKAGSPGRSVYANFREIDKDFTTITSLPANEGEIGADIGTDLEFEKTQVHTDLDFFRDRLLPNEENPRALNYDWTGSVNHDLTDDLSFLTAAYYLDTPGELSPRKNFRWMNTLTQRFKLPADRYLQVFVGASYNRNRLEDLMIAEYDRYAATAGFQINLIEHLNYFANYEYSWLDELSQVKFSNPGVFNTGLTYAKELTEKLSINSSLYYRDEQNAESTNSFLAGEDSLTGSVGFSFRPRAGTELFLDSRLRDVWAEIPDNPSYTEIDVRWGLRSAWDLPFSWSPWGTIQGAAFKDLNADGKKERGEPGIKDVKIHVGNRLVTTDAKGQYKVKLMAKEVLVSADATSVPSGYVLTTPPVQNITLPYKGIVNFGFSTQSGIYGIVFHDLNGDGLPNEGDEFIQNVKITLDGKVSQRSDYDGTYFFKNVSNGKHVILVDVNSLPIEYLPLIKLSQTIDVTEGTVYMYHVPLAKRKN